ncbi:hypothetical protein KAR91_71080 [Candidatus Pacearchaeota archaeon]|nr:hypothetical protein [Candidatus Pacearchaeota archaeon]
MARHQFQKGNPGNPGGIESIKKSLSKISKLPMKISEDGRINIDYVRLAKKRLTTNDMMHLKMMQKYIQTGSPEDYKQYLDTVKTYYPHQRVKEVHHVPTPQPEPEQARGLSAEEVTEILGGSDFDPKKYSDDELKEMMEKIEEAE